MNKRQKTNEGASIAVEDVQPQISDHKTNKYKEIEGLVASYAEDERKIILGEVSKFPDAIESFIKVLKIVQRKTASIPSQSRDSNIVRRTGKKICTIADVSFVMPRKKLSIDVYDDAIQLTSSKGEIEKDINRQNISSVLCLPTKTKGQYHYVLLIGRDVDSSVIFTLIDGKILVNTDTSQNQSKDKDFIHHLFESDLKLRVRETNLAVFSTINKLPFLDCYIKTKDGQLYFLEDCLLFGMKKPLLVIPFDSIQNLSFDEQTSRTFDWTVIKIDGSKVTFSMIAQEHSAVLGAFTQRLLKKKKNTSRAIPQVAPVSAEITNNAPMNEDVEFQVIPNIVEQAAPINMTKDESDSEEEEDDDFCPSEHESIPEDYDEAYQGSDAEPMENVQEDDLDGSLDSNEIVELPSDSEDKPE